MNLCFFHSLSAFNFNSIFQSLSLVRVSLISDWLTVKKAFKLGGVGKPKFFLKIVIYVNRRQTCVRVSDCEYIKKHKLSLANVMQLMKISVSFFARLFFYEQLNVSVT